MRNCSHLHREIVVFERDLSSALAKWPFGFEQFGADETLDDEFCIRRNHQVDRFGFYEFDGLSGECAGYSHFVEIDWETLRPGIANDWTASDNDGAGHRFAH